MIKTNPALFYTILCGILFLIIAINVSLFSAFRNRSKRNPMKMSKSIFDRAKSPWEPEDRLREELSNLVHGTQKPDDVKPNTVAPSDDDDD